MPPAKPPDLTSFQEDHTQQLCYQSTHHFHSGFTRLHDETETTYSMHLHQYCTCIYRYKYNGTYLLPGTVTYCSIVLYQVLGVLEN